MSTDAIVLLKNDHKAILKTFSDFEKAGPNATATKERLVNRMIELLTVHTYIENEVMYPRVREALPPERATHMRPVRRASLSSGRSISSVSPSASGCSPSTSAR